MGLPLDSIPRTYTRVGSKMHVRPCLAVGQSQASLISSLSTLLDQLEARVGEARGGFGPADVEPLFPDSLGGYRAARGAWTVLSQWYRFRTPSLDEALGSANAERLRALGIGAASDLRSLLYQRTAQIGGFVDCSSRMTFLEQLASDLSLSDPVLLEKGLWLDDGSQTVLERLDTPTPEDVLAAYRHEMVSGLLFHTLDLTFCLPSGGAWKAAYRLCKLLRLEAEPQVGGKLMIAGRTSALPETTLGGRLSSAAVYLLTRHGARGEARIRLNGKGYTLLLDDELAAVLPSSLAREPSFDSGVEERLFRSFERLGSGRHGWTLEREPDALVAGNTVLIPDFGCRRGAQMVYLEVVGFWTEEYRRKKLAKLRGLARSLPGLKLVLAVAEGQGDYGSLPFPCISYRGEVVASELVALLDRQFDDLNERLPAIRERFESLWTRLEAAGSVAWEDAAALIGCYTVLEAERALEASDVPASVAVVQGLGLCSQRFLAEVAAILEREVPTEGGLAAVDLAADLGRLHGFSGSLTALVGALPGFDLRWRTVFDMEVIRRVGEDRGPTEVSAR